MAAATVDPFPESEIPLPSGVPAPAAPPAPAPVIGPLPYNCKLNADGTRFDIYGYSQTAIAKDWRTPTELLSTARVRPKPDKLFDFPASFLSKQPDELTST